MTQITQFFFLLYTGQSENFVVVILFLLFLRETPKGFS